MHTCVIYDGCIQITQVCIFEYVSYRKMNAYPIICMCRKMSMMMTPPPNPDISEPDRESSVPMLSQRQKPLSLARGGE